MQTVWSPWGPSLPSHKHVQNRAYLVDRFAISLGNKHLGGCIGIDAIGILVEQKCWRWRDELFKIQDRNDLWARSAEIPIR